MSPRRAVFAACLAAAVLGVTGCAASDTAPAWAPPSPPVPPAPPRASASAVSPGPVSPGWVRPAAAAAPARAVPALARLPGRMIGGVEYVGLADVAEELGLQAIASVSGPENSLILRLGVRPVGEFDEHSRSATLFGINASLGDPVVVHGGRFYVSRIDCAKCLLPILRPAFCGRPPQHPRVIAVDAGHGGVDDGTKNLRLGLREKTFTLDTAERLRRILTLRGYRVVMTRTTDVKIELQDRPEIAARAGADVFVSIHFNASPAAPQLVEGLEVYRFTPQFQIPAARAVRKPEDGLPGPGNENDVWNTALGFNLQRTLLGELRTARGERMTDRGVRDDRLAVLHWAECPAILVEGGFLSNDAEGRLIGTPAYREALAGAIADGIDAYGRELDTLRPAGARR